MARLLLVEDERALARTLAKGLREEQFVVDVAHDGEEGLWLARSARQDVIILDLRLPKVPGLEVCRRIRADGDRVPILMLTACDATEDVVQGLDAGANDYLTKPFAFAELLARLRALLRIGTGVQGARMSVGDLELDTAMRRAWRSGGEIPLSNMEYRILEHLMRHAGSVRSRDQLAAAIWDDAIGPDSNVLEVHVSNLRRKIDRGRTCHLLHTRRGSGYLVSAEDV